MKNNFLKIILLLLLSLNFFHTASSDEFNFDVTELQISENGNIIKGLDGGTVTTKNNTIIITADTFKYNKLTTLLEAKGNVRLIDKSEDIIIESNEFFYLKNKEEIYTYGESKAFSGTDIQIDAEQYFKYNKLSLILEAKGNVIILDNTKDVTIKTNEAFYLKKEEKFFTKGITNVFVGKDYTLNSSDLIFLRNSNILSSSKDSIFEDLSLNNIYKFKEFKYALDNKILKGKKINVITNNQKLNSDKFFFESGIFDLNKKKFLAKDVKVLLHKTLFEDEENDPRINSVTAYGDEFNTFFDKGVFTSCKKTDKCPPWKIYSKTIHHDKVKKQIIYKNAWLEIYDFPVVYFPKFFHPDPSVERQSGILSPEIGSHDTLGDSTYVPYFHVISDTKDITIKPRLYNDNKILFQSEYRQKTKNSFTIADFSFLKGHKSEKTDKADTRSHIFTYTKMNLELDKFASSILEINYEKTSNDNYLELFDLKSPLLLKDNGSLESYVKLDLQHENYDFITNIQMHETLSGLNSDRYQYDLPSYTFTRNFELDNINGSLNFNSSGNNNLSATNVVNSGISNHLNYYTYDFFSNSGITTNYTISLKNINSIGKNSLTYKSSPQSELMSAYMFNASYPLQKRTEKSLSTLTPKLSLGFSPHDMKNNSAIGRRIDVNNIFNLDRLGLGNSFEAGETMTLGLNFKKEKINKKDNGVYEIEEIEDYFDFKLATAFRLEEEKKIPITSTLNNKSSYVFGLINYKPITNISLNYNFSLTDDLNRFEYNSLVARADYDNFSTQFDYLEERGIIGKSNVIMNKTQYNFNEENSFSFSTRKNRTLNLTEYYKLLYEYKNDCLIASINYKKNYYNDADIIPLEQLFFSITIVPLATFSPDEMILNKDRLD